MISGANFKGPSALPDPQKFEAQISTATVISNVMAVWVMTRGPLGPRSNRSDTACRTRLSEPSIVILGIPSTFPQAET